MVESARSIPDRIGIDLPKILACWQQTRRADAEDGGYARLAEGMEELTLVFVEFLRSPQTVETFSRGGAVRALVGRIAEQQHELGRDTVGVIEDFAVLRRCVWRSVEGGVDLTGLDGAEVAGFFVKLMQASDWVTEAGLEAFDAITRREMEQALGRAAATDLVTGLPDRDQFNRLLLPQTVASHAAVRGRDLRRRPLHGDRRGRQGRSGAQDRVRALRGRAATSRRKTPSAPASGTTRSAPCCRRRAARRPTTWPNASWSVWPPTPGTSRLMSALPSTPSTPTTPGSSWAEALKALRMAKRVGGSGIVVAH